MTIEISGSWKKAQIESYLGSITLPIRLSCVAADGFPRVVSLWFLYRKDKFYCVTHQSAKLVTLLKHDNRVGFELASDNPPYRGVRGQGIATMSALGEDPALQQLLQRYVGDLESDFSRWLLSRSEDELIISIAPHRLFSWDYRQRMAEVV
ncbi:MAG: pyridoxamine 5'-phosphate oxidase family protein [Halioglobus sp.]